MTVAAGVRPGWVPSDLYPFEDRWADIDGNLVHYVDHGEGPPILLLHGNPSWSFGWRDVIKRLSSTFRCIAPDYPGFGLSRPAPAFDLRPRSQSRVVEALVDRLGVTGVTVFGYAWGGPIGLGFAARRPELVRALVIGNTWAWPDDRLRVRLFSALMGGPTARLLVDRLNLMVRAYLPLNLERAALTAAERRAYEGPFPPERRWITSVFPREITTGRRWLRQLESSLARVASKPALIVWPDSDPGFGEEELGRWQTLLPQAPTVMLRRAGQFIDEDAPDDVANAVLGWWPSVAGDGSTVSPEAAIAYAAAAAPGRRRTPA